MEDKSYVGMSQCFFCGEPKDVLLDRRMRNSLPRMACYDHEPCDKCKDLMKQGIMFIEVKDGESGDNPSRTGHIWVLKEEALERMLNDDDGIKAAILKSRMTFIPATIATQLGLHDPEMQPAWKGSA